MSMKTDGPEVKERFTINCADCNKSLLEVIITKEISNGFTKIKVYCPCGGASYLIPIQGKYRICPVEPLVYKNVVHTENREEVWLS